MVSIDNLQKENKELKDRLWFLEYKCEYLQALNIELGDRITNLVVERDVILEGALKSEEYTSNIKNSQNSTDSFERCLIDSDTC